MKLQDLEKNGNIIGHGKGYKITKGKQTKKKARIIFVKKKLPKSKLKKEDIIPKKIGREITDVIEVGDVMKLTKLKKKSIDRKAKHRPSPCGVSIGHKNITAGTQGAIAIRTSPLIRYEWKECDCNFILKWLVKIFSRCKLMRQVPVEIQKAYRVILSNNHVLADEYMEGDDGEWYAEILQPGPFDGGTMDDKIAELVDVVPLKRTGNVVDAAIAMPYDDADVTEHIIDIGSIRGVYPTVKIGEVLEKSGRTTGYSKAKVIAIDATITVGYDKGPLTFNGQIVTECMSDGGDSGSLVLNVNKGAAGLLFAGSDKITIINPIADVMELLDITFE